MKEAGMLVVIRHSLYLALKVSFRVAREKSLYFYLSVLLGVKKKAWATPR